MIPEVISSSHASDWSTSTVVSKPSGVTEDDLLIAFVYSGVSPTNTPSGWTLLESTVTLYSYVFYKVAGDSEPATYSFDGADQKRSASIICVRGINTSSPINASSSRMWTSYTTSVTANSITTDEANCLVLYGGYSSIDQASFSTPSGMAQVLEYLSTWHAHKVAELDFPTAGATGNKTGTVATTNSGAAALVAINGPEVYDSGNFFMFFK